jgi:hypothetical protein
VPTAVQLTSSDSACAYPAYCPMFACSRSILSSSLWRAAST